MVVLAARLRPRLNPSRPQHFSTLIYYTMVIPSPEAVLQATARSTQPVVRLCLPVNGPAGVGVSQA